MRQIKQLLAVAAASSILAACGSSQFQPPAVQQSNPGSTSYSDLQFAVGTANIAGTTGLNVVSTLRQPDGLTADLVNTPTLTGPFSLASLTTGTGNNPNGGDAYSTAWSNGPSATEKSKNAIMGTPQSVRQGTPACESTSSCPSGVSPNTTTFGQFGGIQRMGLIPANMTPGGSPGSYVPFTDPFYANSTTTPNAWTPWGGPPAYDDSGDHMGTRDGVHHTLGQGVLGVYDGMTVFQVAPVAGSYTLSTVVPTGLNRLESGHIHNHNQERDARIYDAASDNATAGVCG